ncbi:hypothetical protein [Methylobacillus sp.]|uniref:hypothetical protein n=1 Tax=Methylobacillus sp. TaxID=56818 RepID=UPI0012CBB303|nr:hypothetical protein [Methylobacillus sp.]MPS48481.1 hypothetical protein [Methylobacillus sp.]
MSTLSTTMPDGSLNPAVAATIAKSMRKMKGKPNTDPELPKQEGVLSPEDKHQAEQVALANNMNSAMQTLGRTAGAFKVITPCQAAAKTRSSGEYRSATLTGGESLTPSGAYLGKRKGVILLFTTSVTEFPKYGIIEIPLNDAITTLDDRFRDAVRTIVTSQFTEVKVKSKSELEAERKERERREHQAQLNNPLYGAF